MVKPDMSREWELEGEVHRTAVDARRQVHKSKMGALVAATDEYLLALVGDVDEWLVELRAELAKRAEDGPPCDCSGPNDRGIHEDSCATVVY